MTTSKNCYVATLEFLKENIDGKEEGLTKIGKIKQDSKGKMENIESFLLNEGKGSQFCFSDRIMNLPK